MNGIDFVVEIELPTNPEGREAAYLALHAALADVLAASTQTCTTSICLSVTTQELSQPVPALA